MNMLETKRLIIKPTSLDSFENTYALFSDAEVMRYIGNGVKSREEVQQHIEKMIQHHEKHGFSFGDVYEKSTNQFVGRGGLMFLGLNDQQPDIEVGFAFQKQFWKKGYATELARAFLDWGFKHLSVNKFVAVIRQQNNESRRVLEKSGMHYAGMKDYNNHEVAAYEIFRNQTDYNKIKLIEATPDDYPIIQNIGTYYVYDMSEYMGNEEGWKIPEDGIYECMDFKKYWDDVNSFPFVVRYEDELAGFAIVDKKGSDSSIEFNMAQFFIARKFKHKGIAKQVAQQCFDKFKGVWEVMVMPGNEGAYRFWRSTIKKYMHNDFVEYTKKVAHFKTHQHNIFKFDSSIQR